MWIQNILFIHWSANGHLTIFHYLDISTSAALNIAWTRVFSFPGHLPWSGVSGSQNAKFCFLRNRLIPVGLRYCVFLPEANKVSTFSTSLSAFVHVFLITAIVISVKWYLIVLFCISLMVSNIEHHLMCLFSICIFSLKKCLFKSPAHFKIVFLLLKSSSYILDTVSV